ncbi:MAG: hypothetical protein SOV59_06120 [Fusobacterium mortiferum]|jgi:hypothetical protein|nr:hypothetical protein [Fusobacterium mortiferum]
MKKSILLVGVLLSAMAYASSDTIVPIEVERNINKFYQDSDFSQKNQYANMQRKAYIEMMDYINNSDIPTEEKEGILRNVESMYPNNYVMQKVEAKSRVDHVKSLM